MSPWRISGQFQRDGLFVLPAILNARVFRLLFDPGAAFSSVVPNVAAILKLQVVGRQSVFQGGFYPVSCPVFLLDSFQIGFIRRVNMRMIGMPLDPRLNFIGILGMDFLRQYRFTVEPDTATLILRPRRK
jgi:predicted aspartyl protease